LYRTWEAGQSGAFNLSGVPAGSYTLFAWEGVPIGSWTVPQFLAKYEGQGVEVFVEAGKETVVKVPVIWLK
jgi:hypothetical protein